VSLVNPLPSVTLTRPDGVPMTFTTTAAQPVAGIYGLDDISVTWGRQHTVEHQDAQTAKFRLFYADAFPGFLVGQPVTMSWTDPVSATTRTFFRGRVTDQVVTARPRAASGAVRGAWVDLTATGQLAELGNRLTGTETWPDESVDARINRLRTIAGTSVAGIDYRAFFATAPVAGRTVDGLDCLSLLQSLYDSLGGDRLVYDPHTNRVGYVRRRAIPAPAGGAFQALNRLRLDPALYTGGVHISANTAGATRWPMIDARWIEGGDKLSKSLGSAVTRVVKHWTEAGVAKSSVIIDFTTEAARGVVAADLQTEYRQSDWADGNGSDWWEILTQEGQTFTPNLMTYRADKAGGFDTLALAQLLIGGAESADPSGTQGGTNMFFLAGSPWSSLGINPAFGVMGGVIRFRHDVGWTAGLYTGRGFWQGTTAPAITCQDLRANSTRDAFALQDLAHSVSWSDFRNVQSW
jgi:hypothetical protein